MKVANYTDNGRLANIIRIIVGQLYPDSWYATIRIWKLATYRIMEKLANYRDMVRWPTHTDMVRWPPIGIIRIVGHLPDIRIVGHLSGYPYRWPTIRKMEGGQLSRIWKLATYTISDMELANYTDMKVGQVYGYGRRPTIRICRWPTIRV